ncbi:MAG: signal recognition particle-docking protein FtsY [Candidatus Aenigmatarchaeota archaeon]|nr:MAG: signal recognition particle-docking protein FtsY [Candidatus Aenigmarchaeota archaeon]
MLKLLKKVFSRSKQGLEKKVKRIAKKRIAEGDIDDFFAEIEPELLQANVALEAVEALKVGLKRELVGKEIKRGQAGRLIRDAFKRALLELFVQEKPDIFKLKRPVLLLFLGFNGSGKTTTIAKVANLLLKKKLKPVLAAGDTFRAASIEQLEEHARRLGVEVVKHKYGSDSAAVIFDARKHAEAKGLDFILADTAGRSHANVNLMDELKKVVRVNRPNLKILVLDSLTGNDAVEQARKFDEAVGVDAVVLTKVDVNEKGGSILSVAWAIRKPILWLGTGQKYDDLKPFDPEKFVEDLVKV